MKLLIAVMVAGLLVSNQAAHAQSDVCDVLHATWDDASPSRNLQFQVQPTYSLDIPGLPVILNTATIGLNTERQRLLREKPSDKITKAEIAELFQLTNQIHFGELGLSEAERIDLRARSMSHRFDGFEPSCGWAHHAAADFKGTMDDALYSFTNPLFSSDGKVAFIATSHGFSLGGSGRRGGGGKICVIRKQEMAWQAKCIAGWVT